MPLRAQLEDALGSPFPRLTYTQAVRALQQCDKDFEHPVRWGAELQTEHERWLSEDYCGGRPVFVTDYPAACKPFYMRLNDLCDGANSATNESASGGVAGETVAAFDLL